MTSTPPRLEDSLDTSDIATPCTVIERMKIRDDVESDEEQNNDSDEDEDEEEDENDYFEGKSQCSAQFSQTSEATTTVKQPFPMTTTKVYCHIDEETTLYLMEVHVPPDLITLGDVKRVLMRTNFKYYCKALDPDSGYEVKAEVRDDAQKLIPLPNGRFELFLLTIEGSTLSDGGSSGRMRKTQHSVPAPAPSNSKHMNYHHAAYQFDNSMMSTDSESMISAAVPSYLKNAYARRFPHYLGGGKCFLKEKKEIVARPMNFYQKDML